jgi:hypothetical protein
MCGLPHLAQPCPGALSTARTLNMAEPEFSLLHRQCQGRRIPDRTALETEVATWETARNEQRATIR